MNPAQTQGEQAALRVPASVDGPAEVHAVNPDATAQANGSTTYGGYTQRSYAYSNAGNITSFEGAALAYNAAAHKHAVTHIGGVQKYWYDANGNATRRITPWGLDITMAYDAENRLTQVSNGVTASYTYDGDGNRVKAVVNGTTSVYVGAYFEVTGGITRTYYYAGNVRVAERYSNTLYFLLTDHLGSTATTTDASGGRQYSGTGGAGPEQVGTMGTEN